MSDSYDTFLSGITGQSNQPPPDPNERLIAAERMGYRPYNRKIFTGLTLFTGSMTVITLAERVPFVRNLALLAMFAGLVGMCLFDIVKTSSMNNGYIRNSQIYLTIGSYVLIAVVVGLFIALIINL